MKQGRPVLLLHIKKSQSWLCWLPGVIRFLCLSFIIFTIRVLQLQREALYREYSVSSASQCCAACVPVRVRWRSQCPSMLLERLPLTSVSVDRDGKRCFFHSSPLTPLEHLFTCISLATWVHATTREPGKYSPFLVHCHPK